jgi:hypothetical protein
MDSTATRPSDSRQRPTMIDLQRAQMAALRSGDRRRVAAYQAMIFRRLEEAQAAFKQAG